MNEELSSIVQDSVRNFNDAIKAKQYELAIASMVNVQVAILYDMDKKLDRIERAVVAMLQTSA